MVILWLIALGIGGQRIWHARESFASPATDPVERQRVDGNSGHAEIDFGGQWVMGRMLVEGHARQLYHRGRQWQVVREAFPVEKQAPIVRSELLVPVSERNFPTRSGDNWKHDADWMMYWFMGEDSPEWRVVGGSTAAALVPALPPFGYPPTAALTQLAARERVSPVMVEEVSRVRIGGPLYPPVHAFLMAPLAIENDPQKSYYRLQILALGLAYLAALGASRLSRGRVWWSVASIVLLLYPGCRASLDLAQNSTLTLAILVWGWVLASRGREGAGGVVWGLLAFKPTWAAAFLLVPLLTRRWRFVLAMSFTGIGLVLATLPFVGVQTWFDWLQVGQEASKVYDVNQNWNFLSRDLQGFSRRWLLDFSKPEELRRNATAALIGWGLWAVVFLTTIVITLTRVDRKRTIGVGMGFLFLGAYLSCYRFMYYDALLSFLGVAVLFADWGRFHRFTVFELTPASSRHTVDAFRQANLPAPRGRTGPRMLGYVNSLPLTLLVALVFYEDVLIASNVQATFGFPLLAGSESTGTPRVQLDTSLNTPWDTYFVLALWAWCGLRLILGEEKGRSSLDPQQASGETPRSASSAAPMSGERISVSPTSTA